jgi:hypothetical protein
MPTTKYARIAITLPEEDLAAADRIAKDLDRSRSWVIAEAIRVYAARPVDSPQLPLALGLGASRLAQLRADLALTPEQRVREAEATAHAVPRRDRGRVNRVVFFERFEDYLDWKTREAAGG